MFLSFSIRIGPRSNMLPDLINTESRWKHSFVSPLFKTGDSCNVASYCLVCIQSTMPKAQHIVCCAKGIKKDGDTSA